jgi:hypothetical protein
VKNYFKASGRIVLRRGCDCHLCHCDKTVLSYSTFIEVVSICKGSVHNRD